MRSRQRGARRRGATFTFVCIIFSLLLLLGASIHLRTVTHVDGLSALQARRTVIREAAFGGLRWAGRDAATAAAAAGGATLHLAGVDVRVEWKRGDDGVVQATSHARGADELKVRGSFVKKGEALLLEASAVE